MNASPNLVNLLSPGMTDAAITHAGIEYRPRTAATFWISADLETERGFFKNPLSEFLKNPEMY